MNTILLHNLAPFTTKSDLIDVCATVGFILSYEDIFLGRRSGQTSYALIRFASAGDANRGRKTLGGRWLHNLKIRTTEATREFFSQPKPE